MNIKQILEKFLPKATHDYCDCCQDFQPLTHMLYSIDKGIKLHVCKDCAENIEVGYQ